VDGVLQQFINDLSREGKRRESGQQESNEKASEEGNCPDVVVGKEESAHEENTHEEKSAHATPKGIGSGMPTWGLFSHTGHSFGRNETTSKTTKRSRQKITIGDMLEAEPR
jgi:hypothetical protein